MSGAKVWPGLVTRATIPKSSADAACRRRFSTKSSSTRSEMTKFSSLHVPSVNTRLLGREEQREGERQKKKKRETDKTQRETERDRKTWRTRETVRQVKHLLAKSTCFVSLKLKQMFPLCLD
jgi:hypothetical protein